MDVRIGAVASKDTNRIQDASASQEPQPSQLEGRQRNILKSQDMIIVITRISILQSTSMNIQSHLSLLLIEDQSQGVKNSLMSR